MFTFKEYLSASQIIALSLAGILFGAASWTLTPDGLLDQVSRHVYDVFYFTPGVLFGVLLSILVHKNTHSLLESLTILLRSSLSYIAAVVSAAVAMLVLGEILFFSDLLLLSVVYGFASFAGAYVMSLNFFNISPYLLPRYTWMLLILVPAVLALFFPYGFDSSELARLPVQSPLYHLVVMCFWQVYVLLALFPVINKSN